MCKRSPCHSKDLSGKLTDLEIQIFVVWSHSWTEASWLLRIVNPLARLAWNLEIEFALVDMCMHIVLHIVDLYIHISAHIHMCIVLCIVFLYIRIETLYVSHYNTYSVTHIVFLYICIETPYTTLFICKCLCEQQKHCSHGSLIQIPGTNSFLQDSFHMRRSTYRSLWAKETQQQWKALFEYLVLVRLDSKYLVLVPPYQRSRPRQQLDAP